MKPFFANLGLYWTLLALLCPTGAAAAKDVASEDARASGKAFFEQNARKEGVVSLPSGLQYRVLSPGKGARPRAIDTVVLQYRGTTLDGTEVDSSESGGSETSVRVAQTMPGWREALLLMEEGAKWELFIPPGLGYTRQRGSKYTRSGDLTSEPLIFQLELLEVKRPDRTSFASLGSRTARRGPQTAPHVFVYLMGESTPQEKPQGADTEAPLAITTESLAQKTPADATPTSSPVPATGAEDKGGEQPQASGSGAAEAIRAEPEVPPAAVAPAAATPAAAMFDDPAMQAEVIGLPNGLKYRVVRQGDGVSPKPGDTVEVHYRGSLADGREFDSSYRHGGPARFGLDEAIPGWQELLQRMQVGASWVLYVPPELGYRKPGPLSGEALVFEVELLAVSEPERPPGAASEAGAQGTEQLVIRLPSGLSYRVLRNGRGLSPLAGDSLSLEYREQTGAEQQARGSGQAEGQVTLPLDWLIPAWRSLLMRMEEGARWEIRIPPELLHPAWLRRPGQPVTLEVELLSVTPAVAEGIAFASLEVGAEAAAVPAGAADTAPPVQHRVLRPGTGDRPHSEDSVTLRYRSTLLDARGFGHAYHDEGRLTLRLDQAEPSWRQVLGDMRPGSHWQIAVVSDRLPASWAPLSGRNALLELELLAIEPPGAARPTTPQPRAAP